MTRFFLPSVDGDLSYVTAPSILKTSAISPRLVLVLLACISALLSIPQEASAHNRLYRVEIRPKKDFTRIAIKLESSPKYTLTPLTGNRVRLILSDTGGPLFKKFRRYSDAHIGGLDFRRRGQDLLVTFQAAQGTGWRDISLDGVNALTLDVGKAFVLPPLRPATAGREKIWNGSEKLVRDFDPPLKAEIPFLPTDQQVLKSLLTENDMQAFMDAEGSLYKGRLSEAEEIFVHFAAQQAPIKSLALYRLGETYYKLQKYPQALEAFREAERWWPAFLNHNPGVTFYYGDSIARGGDLATARSMLSSLISKLADKKFAPVLLVRLADILVRQGHEQEALGIYRTVAESFTDNKAHLMALLRLHDRDFFRTTSWDYRKLGGIYQDISRQSGDVDLREEALFKYVLLESLHGESAEALRQVMEFQKRFPRGVYATVCRTMREVLVAQVYHEMWASIPAASATTGTSQANLIRFVEEHNDYLAGCVQQPGFMATVVQAYEGAGRPIELIKLFDTLLQRQWAAAEAPFMHEVIADNAELLGDNVMAEKMRRAFLRKFPTHAHARTVMEQLGGLYFGQAKYQSVSDTLLWLLNKGERAALPESYYYLGRSLWMLRQPAQSIRAMDLYLTGETKQGGRSSQLLPDAYFVAASAREAAGDRKGALRLLETGLKLPSNERHDEMLYKTGELNLAGGKRQVARDCFEQVAQKGSDPDWKRLAQQALQSLDTNTGASALR